MRSQLRNPALKLLLGLSVLVVSDAAVAQSRSANAIVGVTNDGFIYSLDRMDTAGSPASAFADHSFTGLDSGGNSRTMNMVGQVNASSQFGQLHCFSTLSASNVYYNAANDAYADPSGGLNNPDGSPKTVTSLAFAVFDDVLQFGGNLQSGYQARYIFRIDGTNSGTEVPFGDGALANLYVEIADDPGELLFITDAGFSNQTWATSGHEVNGITPQSIHVQFSNQIVYNLPLYADGDNLQGTSDFSATAILEGIEMLDANGNPVSGWTVTSASGTQYTMLQPVPEPTTMAVLALGAVAVLRRRRK
jgi:hypothetical protein